MSRHFTYEIDERNLRVKLKDIEAPYKESAWEKFEAFSASQHTKNADQGLSGIKISFNRNVIMLVVFGSVIVTFSFLLFNFISIKNPKKAGAQNLEESRVMAAEKTVETKPVVQTATVTAVAAKTVAAVKDTVIVKKENIAEAKPVVAEPAPVVEKKAEEPVPVVAKAESRSPEEAAKKAEEDAKRAEEFEKRRERRANAALAKKIKPATVTEDDSVVAPQ